LYRGVATSSKNIQRLTPEERKAIILEPETSKNLIGIMLSDGHVSLCSKSVNASFHFAPQVKSKKKQSTLLL